MLDNKDFQIMTHMPSPAPAELAACSVGDIATRVPGATALFRRHKIPFCCGGEASLAEVAADRRIPLEGLVSELAALGACEAAPQTGDKNELARHIVARYHEAHRRELPELLRLARKVERVHGDHPSAPHGLAEQLEKLQNLLTARMDEEETVLFPALASGDLARAEELSAEHAGFERSVHELEHLTGGFEPPAGACRSWQALYAGGAKLVDDLRGHLALERALAT